MACWVCDSRRSWIPQLFQHAAKVRGSISFAFQFSRRLELAFLLQCADYVDESLPCFVYTTACERLEVVSLQSTILRRNRTCDDDMEWAWKVGLASVCEFLPETIRLNSPLLNKTFVLRNLSYYTSLFSLLFRDLVLVRPTPVSEWTELRRFARWTFACPLTFETPKREGANGPTAHRRLLSARLTSDFRLMTELS